MNSQSVILQTKLFPPPATEGHILRNHLIKKLELGRRKPLTLVSAPAGYGKSSLVSSWLGMLSTSSSWLSLDAEDNNLHTFAAYVVHSIQTSIPTFGDDILQILRSPEPTTAKTIITHFINALAQVDQPLIVVLDDYHLINKPEIHEMVETLLRFPIRQLNLVLICRSDPPIPVVEYRLNDTIQEIRTKDFIFNRAEIANYFEQNLKYRPNSRRWTLSRIKVKAGFRDSN